MSLSNLAKFRLGGDIAINRIGFGAMQLLSTGFYGRATPVQIALAWLLAYSRSMLIIPGTAFISHLEEKVAADVIRLTEEPLADLG